MSDTSNRQENHDDEHNSDTQNPRHTGDAESEENGNDKPQHAGILEKIFTVLSVILIVGLIGYLVRETFKDSTPPSFELQTSAPQQRGQYVTIAIIIDNTGDKAAKAVEIRGEVPGPDGQPIEAEATMDWLPGKSRRHATLLFPASTTLDNLEVNIVGYEEP